MSPRPGGDVSNSAEFAITGAASTGERPVLTEPSAVAAMLRDHPAMAVGFSYMVLTVVGLIHEVWFYRDFHINILDYLGLGDVLAAPVRNSLSVILSLVPGLMLLWFGELRRRRKALDAHAPQFLRERLRRPAWRLAAYTSLAFMYSVLFTQVYAANLSERVKAGTGQRVSLSRDEGLAMPENPILIGSTTNFFFLYYPKRKVTEIVPVENTSLLTVESASARDGARDTVETAGVHAGDTGGSPAMRP